MGMTDIEGEVEVPVKELSFTFARSGGPGGQNVNKVNSKAILSWNVLASRSLKDDVRERFIARFGRRLTGEGILVIASDRFRDQSKNVADCCEKLRAMLQAVAVAPKSRRPTRPTRSAVEKRLQGKQLRSQRKQLRKVDY